MSAPVDVLAVPAKFYDDHGDRDLPTPAEVRRAGSRVYIDRNDPAIPALLSDAKFYADPWGPDELPPGLKVSAIRTVAALARCSGGAK